MHCIQMWICKLKGMLKMGASVGDHTDRATSIDHLKQTYRQTKIVQ